MKEIQLVLHLSNHFYQSYKAEVLPSIGDWISLEEDEIFVVKQRLLPNNNNNRFVLIGELQNYKNV